MEKFFAGVTSAIDNLLNPKRTIVEEDQSAEVPAGKGSKADPKKPDAKAKAPAPAKGKAPAKG